MRCTVWQVLGTPVEAIMATEDRDVFNQKLAGETESVETMRPAGIERGQG